MSNQLVSLNFKLCFVVIFCLQAAPNVSVTKNDKGEEVIGVGSVQVIHISGYKAEDWSSAV